MHRYSSSSKCTVMVPGVKVMQSVESPRGLGFQLAEKVVNLGTTMSLSLKIKRITAKLARVISLINSQIYRA